MVEQIWILVGLLVLDFIIALVLRRTGLDRVFEAISIICFVIPMAYFLLDWDAGIMNGTYTINDLPDKIKEVLLYGLGFAFTGGMTGYFLGGFRNNSGYSS